MKPIYPVIILIALVAIGLLIWFWPETKEKYYPYYTYVNTPLRRGLYPNYSSGIPPNWWGGNYYYRLNWRPWGYHRPGYYSARPGYYGGSLAEYYQTPQLADSGNNPGAVIPAGDAVPLDTIRWNSPMLASLKYNDYPLGKWVNVGIAYTDNPNDFTTMDVYQQALDPGRDLYAYQVQNKDGQYIPVNLPQNHTELKDGDRFKVQGLEGKGDFVFSKADKYTYVYS
jgi:hypothetical protein